MYLSEKAVQSNKVLLAESNKKQQSIAKLSLSGTGVELDIVENIDEGKKLIKQKKFDIIYVCSSFIELAQFGHKLQPDAKIVLSTTRQLAGYLEDLTKYPFLSNIIHVDEEDSLFLSKNIFITVSKIVTNNIFGLEKYLNWGIEVHEMKITGSQMKYHCINKLKEHLAQSGLRQSAIVKAVIVTEELAMNAIWDAPIDEEGNEKYNHLPRSEALTLKDEEQAKLRYAFDGSFLAISVEDPFGSITRDTILKYLKNGTETHYLNLNDSLGKGGGGLGIYQVMSSADLVIVNVKKRVKTEFIALINIRKHKRGKRTKKSTSFHYFAA